MTVLRVIDRGLGLVGWVAAAGLVLMLFIGPQLVAEEEPQPAVQSPAGASGASGAAATGGVAGLSVEELAATLLPARRRRRGYRS